MVGIELGLRVWKVSSHNSKRAARMHLVWGCCMPAKHDYRAKAAMSSCNASNATHSPLRGLDNSSIPHQHPHCDLGHQHAAAGTSMQLGAQVSLNLGWRNDRTRADWA